MAVTELCLNLTVAKGENTLPGNKETITQGKGYLSHYSDYSDYEALTYKPPIVEQCQNSAGSCPSLVSSNSI